ncbi:MAG: NADH:ubiquinone reductase (Na(+)-transporting) subunit C [Bacteroidota bacterium]
MHSTKQIIIFVFIMTSVVAVILAGMSTALKPKHELNEAIYAKKAILAAVEKKLEITASELTTEQVINIFDSKIKQDVFDMKGNPVTKDQIIAAGYKGGLAESIDMIKESKKPESERLLPMYTLTDDSGKKTYIFSVIGKGLWDRIWGNIAVEEDLKTVAGVDFDHAGETPGLGAEIKDNAAWKRQFVGKRFVDNDGNITGVGVIKGGAKEPEWQVDGISGATITADGVDEMLARGLGYYGPVIKSLQKS